MNEVQKAMPPNPPAIVRPVVHVVPSIIATEQLQWREAADIQRMDNLAIAWDKVRAPIDDNAEFYNCPTTMTLGM